MVTASGYELQLGITLPDDTQSVSISTNGIVSVQLPGQSSPTTVGNLQLTNFINPTGLQAIGENLYIESASSGSPQEGTPGDTGLGRLRQGSLESSNDRFVISSDTPGSASTVEITAIDTQTNADFGFSAGSGVDGTDFNGSIGGQAAIADGQFITSLSGNSKGLVVEVLSGGAGNRGSISVTRGVADRLDVLMASFLEADGFISSREESINQSLDDIIDEGIKLDDRIASLESRLIRQFSAFDAMIAQFNQTSRFLTQQLASLPKPNSIGGNK